MKAMLENFLPECLDDSLWDEGAWGRSEALTVVYAQRYAGPLGGKTTSSHPYWEIGFVMKGALELNWDESRVVREGEMYLVPPEMVHYEASEKSIEVIWVGLRGTVLADYNKGKMQIGRVEELRRSMEELWFLSQHVGGGVGPELDGLAMVVLSRFIRRQEGADDQEAASVIAWLNGHYQRDIRADELAERFGYSVGYFYRWFKGHTGQTPMEMVTEIRLRHALQMMRNTDLTVKEISRMVGYQDALYFSRLVKKHVGENVRRVRERLRGG